MKKVILAYIPVPHSGYRKLFDRHKDIDLIFLVGPELLVEFEHLRKNLPAIHPQEVQAAIEAMNWTKKRFQLATKKTLSGLNAQEITVVMPREDITIALAEKYLDKCIIAFDSYFLRWDKERTVAKQDVSPDCIISSEQFDIEIMDSLDDLKNRSSDFWRQVAAMAVHDKCVIKFAYNKQVPDQEGPYFYGDPRFNFTRGVAIELSTAEHAEARLIALCARDGIALQGTSLYVTTFPCPVCAKAVATAGFSKCYFREGYSMLDAESVLRSAGVELIQII